MLQWYLMKVVVHISKSFGCQSSAMLKGWDYSLRMLGILKGLVFWPEYLVTYMRGFSFLEMLWHCCDTRWFNSRRGDLKP